MPPLALAMLHHVSRVTLRLEESRAFYRDVLGFQEIPRPDFDFDGAWLFRAGLQIHLIVDATRQPSGRSLSTSTAPINSRDNHIAFETEDIEAVERRLNEHGIVYRENRQATTGVKQLFFRDPDGYYIEVGHYGPTKTSGKLGPA